MPRGHLSSRTSTTRERHHLWNNNGTWWMHFTLHFGHRKRRIRRSLKTRSLDEAIRRRDELFGRIACEGEWIEERSEEGGRMLGIGPQSLHASPRPLIPTQLDRLSA
jgi:hypothetical protein